MRRDSIIIGKLVAATSNRLADLATSRFGAFRFLA